MRCSRLGYDEPLGPWKGIGWFAEYVWLDAFYMDNANLLKAPGYGLVTRGSAGLPNNILKKGSKGYLEGQMQTRKWQDQSGQDKYTTEMVLQNFNSQLTMLDRASNGAAPDETAASRKKGASGNDAKRGDMDDEIPF